MADETITTEALEETPAKSYSEDELQQIIKKRVRKHAEENKRLQERLEALTAPAPPQDQSATGLEGEPSMQPQQPPQQQSAPPTTQNAPLTADMVRQMLEENQQAQATNQAAQYHTQNVQRMMTEDPEFAKLNKQDNPLHVPASVAIHISNSLSHEHAKKLFKELLTNEMSNLKMSNAVLSGTYNEWLQKILSNDMPKDDEDKKGKSVPDLASEQAQHADAGDNFDETMLNYIRRG